MKIYALIPARSGSKGLKDKNIKLINERALIDYSISFAKRLSSVDRVFCSTDSQHYADIAIDCGAEVPFLRSADAAADKAMEQHILHDLREKFRSAGIEEPDLIVWLRPTFVFRSVVDVEECVQALIDDNTLSAARTVVEAENRLYSVDEGKLYPNFQDMGKSMMRRQDMKNSFKVFSTDVFRFKGNPFRDDFLGARIKPVITNSICGMDIDTKFDFELVKLLIENSKESINEYLS